MSEIESAHAIQWTCSHFFAVLEVVLGAPGPVFLCRMFCWVGFGSCLAWPGLAWPVACGPGTFMPGACLAAACGLGACWFIWCSGAVVMALGCYCCCCLVWACQFWGAAVLLLFFAGIAFCSRFDEAWVKINLGVQKKRMLWPYPVLQLHYSFSWCIFLATFFYLVMNIPFFCWQVTDCLSLVRGLVLHLYITVSICFLGFVLFFYSLLTRHHVKKTSSNQSKWVT